MTDLNMDSEARRGRQNCILSTSRAKAASHALPPNILSICWHSDINGWMDGWMDRSIERQIDRSIDQ